MEDGTHETLIPVAAVTSSPAKPKKAKKTPKPKAPKPVKAPKLIPEAELYPKHFAGLTPPQVLYKNKTIGKHEITDKWGNIKVGTLHLAGVGSVKAEIMFISPCTFWEEEFEGRSGLKSQMLKGPFGSLFKRNLGRAGIKTEDWFYTALCKYNVPGLKPKGEDLRWNRAALLDELKTIKPKLIVCLGKQVFDQFTELRCKLGDIQGGFFKSEEHNCLLYPMDPIQLPMQRPEHLERFIVDLKQVKQALDESRGIKIERIETHYSVLDTSEKIGNWVREQLASVPRNMAVDCEWHGRTYVGGWATGLKSPIPAETTWSPAQYGKDYHGGQLRAMQASWKIGHACYIRFMDDALAYALDQPLPEIARMLQPLLNHQDLKFVGHNFFADALWMRNHLAVNTDGRCAFDTLFAQHTLDESADLKLERLAVRFTDLGRYDIPLLLWKKKNKFDEDHNAGYGLVPDPILIDYAARDVDCTMRLFPQLLSKLIQTNQWNYYRTIVLPFVSDGFTELTETGFPMNTKRMGKMRKVFTRNQNILIRDFREVIDQEASTLLLDKLAGASGSSDMFFELRELREQHYQLGAGPVMESQEFEEALVLAKASWEHEAMIGNLEFFLHWWTAPGFNINSTDHLRRWLFAVKGYLPLKTTKKDGFQTSWERVAALPKAKQAEYTPATDKQTIKLLAEKDPLVARVQELKGVANIVKAFLKGPDEEGREQGLMAWIQLDGRIHPNYALTETARPRSWSPNVLNWTKNVTKPIEAAFSRANKIAADEYQLRTRRRFPDMAAEKLQRQVQSIMQTPVSVRSFVQAPPGWCIIDMDFKTAEVVQLAYVAGDANLIGVLTSPDPQFARIDPKNPKKVVRIAFNELSAYPVEAQDQTLIKLDDPRIMRDSDGKIMHPLRDLHWELGETVMGGPREKMDEELVRGVGKIGNFSVPYGASDKLLERMVEVNTGRKPAEGIGQKIIDSYSTRYAIAWRHLSSMETRVEDPGWIRATSGRVRHFAYHKILDVAGLSEYARKGILSPLQRQARNYQIQEGVAATAARAMELFLERRKQMGLDARMFCLLYDAMSILAPLAEVKDATGLLRDCMTTWNVWENHGRRWHHDVDVSYALRWGCKLTPEEKEVITPHL